MHRGQICSSTEAFALSSSAKQTEREYSTGGNSDFFLVSNKQLSRGNSQGLNLAKAAADFFLPNFYKLVK